MTTALSPTKIMSVLDWAYDKSVNGVAGLDSAVDLAQDYLNQDGTLEDQVNSLIRWQNTKAGTSGFVTGLGGLIVLPITIPANIASVMFLQVRMIAAIAYMGGHKLNDDRVKTLVYLCLTGNAAKDVMKDFGIVVGTKIAENALRKMNVQVIREVNKRVGFRLLTKFGEKGAVNLSKMVPILGGVVGAACDSIATNAIGNVARRTFVSPE